MIRILFVDDEQNVLSGLKRALRGMRDQWEMRFASGGEEALTLLREQESNVVVSDIRMPGMNGVELLKAVKQDYPHTIRIALTGHADLEIAMEAAAVAQRYLSKPCETESLTQVIQRAMALRALLGNERLQKLVARLDQLPSLPRLYLEIVDKLNSPDSSVEQIAAVIEQDVAMTAKILQLANSVYFGHGRHARSTFEAVKALGLDMVKGLVLANQVFSTFDRGREAGLCLEEFLRHSSAVAALANRIYLTFDGDAVAADSATMAGMLHDIGRLVLGANLPQEYRQVCERAQHDDTSLWLEEQDAFGASHTEVGAYLLGLWGLPDPIVEAVLYHHTPCMSEDSYSAPINAVHIANGLLHGNGQLEGIQDTQCLARLGLLDRLPEWQQLYLQLMEPEVGAA